MKKQNWIVVLSLLLMLVTSSACGVKKQDKKNTTASDSNESVKSEKPAQPEQLPVRYQTPGYIASQEAANEDLGGGADEYQIKVGATIRSTGGPQPLWDVMKRLANLKGMTVSWASDVNQDTPVDVDISANDNFFDAIANLLRQADYFHEVKGKSIVIKYKDTKIYQLGIPAMKGSYATTVGGNFLTNKFNTGGTGSGTKGSNNTGTEGTIKITSDKNEFDIWDNVKLNLDTILEVWSIRREAETLGLKKQIDEEARTAARTYEASVEQGGKGAGTKEKTSDKASDKEKGKENKAAGSTERSTQAYYTIDRSVGMISVTAPRPLLEKVDQYIDSLKKALYQQVAIEAKIIEVYLQDNSKIGLDWSSVLKDFAVTGTTYFGTAGSGGDGQVYPWIPAKGDAESVTRFVSKIALTPKAFTVMLNALNEQGDTHVLANPKLTVLNGQPAIISVGKDIAYIRTVTKDVDTDTNEVSYTAEVDNVVQGVALGVMASIIDNKKVILHLTPITTDLEGDEIPYREFGDEGLEVGLPRVSIREMSTMVEVENGEMLVIGGLIDSIEQNTGDFAPIVGSIPIVKYLFGVEEKIKQKRELVILLTPKLI